MCLSAPILGKYALFFDPRGGLMHDRSALVYTSYARCSFNSVFRLSPAAGFIRSTIEPGLYLMVGHHSPVFYSFRRIVIVYKAVSFNIQAMCSSTVSTITITKVEKFLPLLSLPAASGRFCVRLVNTSCSGSVHKDYLLPLHDSLLIPIHKGYCGCIQVVHAACISAASM